jgi:hypothetical protein
MRTESKIARRIRLARLQARLQRRWAKLARHGLRDPMPLPTDRVDIPDYMVDASTDGGDLANQDDQIGVFHPMDDATRTHHPRFITSVPGEQAQWPAYLDR